jgi:hypothetical protein
MAKHDNPTAKRPHETHWQWCSRLAMMKQEQRDRDEPIVPREAQRHARYDDDFVMHIETGTITSTKRRRQVSSLVRMHNAGQLDNAQFEAAMKIANIAGRIEADVSVRCASLEARVDNSSGNRDVLVEQIGRVRDEAAYTRWRQAIPMPKRMILDMVMADQPLANTARKFNMGWPAARKRFISALDLWCKLRDDAGKDIDERDVSAAHARIARAA